MPAEPHYWVNTICADHVQRGVAGRFTQADHGRVTRLRALRPGDGIVFYSPRTTIRGGDPVREFTAIGTVTGDEPYQVTMSPEFRPWRVAVAFHECHPAAIAPLIDCLSFITAKAHWGLPFRRGLFQISGDDFAVIRHAMAG